MKQHHHHHHEDDASIFVRETKAAKKRKKIFMQALFVTMCILAFVIVAYAIYIYI
jgi:cell division protein FtsL